LRINGDVGADELFEPVQHFARFGVASNLFLGENQVAVDFHVKHAAAAGDEGEVNDYMLIMGENIFRRTDGSI
jgi:hypothetical protein